MFRLLPPLVINKSSCLLIYLCVLLAVVVQAKQAASARKLSFLNESNQLVEVYWVNHVTQEKVLMSTPHIFPRAEFKLDSFVGHKFEIREKGNAQGICVAQPQNEESSSAATSETTACRSQTFVVSENDGQVVKVFPDFSIEFVDNKVAAFQQASELMEECQLKAQNKIQQPDSSSASSLAAMTELVDCVQGGIALKLQEMNEEIAFQASIRRNIAGLLENYTCVDDTMESSDDIVDAKIFTQNNQQYTVHVKHDRPASKIHVIENFISPEECEAMEAAAEKKLHRATVADGKGGSRLSDARKAMQAGIKVPWHKEKLHDPIATLSRRVYDYTNHVLGLDIEEHGQEDLMSIQYFGRGIDDEQPDRYTPHCDGDCTGLPHKNGTRMATMVMYCDVADRGGHTNFRNAGVHVKPEKGSAVFFSYIDPVTKTMDSGFTEHSGCPVFEGSKKIVTQWVRLGVDAENPWNSFNTLGIKHSDAKKLTDSLDDEL